ncbi:MAG: iron-containing redox enzyme family protein [Bdellovibrionales bacterium]|nr:iron-containing redox enzyme family protein [Bdellovibrionales bacterium]
MSKASLERLEEIIAEMADEVRPWIKQMDRDRYVAYLDMMFHYTRRSGDRMKAAAQTCEREELKDFFEQLSHDEATQYKLAEKDLEALDRRPTEDLPPEIEDFEEFWSSIDEESEVSFLGALYVLEGVADPLGDDLTQALKALALQDGQTRFVRVHGEADAEHGERARELCALFVGKEHKLLFAGARAAADLWIDIHRACLEP